LAFAERDECAFWWSEEFVMSGRNFGDGCAGLGDVTFVNDVLIEMVGVGGRRLEEPP
tara:strand:+ start:860 stop:1030 length:171 start_codon:yes stop_codon:yes gene_type:complete